jgi:hypothetical protein
MHIFGTIPSAQFIGGLVSVALCVLGGIYLLWIWPVEARRNVQSGKWTEAEAQERLRKAKPKYGYLLFIAAICDLIVQLTQWHSKT